jgi:hypothetical protein
MDGLAGLKRRSAPAWWTDPCLTSEVKFHQISPYIGKLKSSIAADLVERYSSAGEIVLDPFCGSGTIPLECKLRGRRVVASDSNPYAVLLTRAKLSPPRTEANAILDLEEVLRRSERRRQPDLRLVPLWVRRFFHPDTLRDVIRFADQCIADDAHFLLACLLGILHHQRPGFLSFPSSHLVPYLRDKKFPRAQFPGLYEYRGLEPRMRSKIVRLYRRGPIEFGKRGLALVYERPIERLNVSRRVDAILTSPPYMNALDYRRDNRLRMWLLDRATSNYSLEPTDRRENFERIARALGRQVQATLRPGGYCVLVVGETVRRKRIMTHPAERIAKLFSTELPKLKLQQIIKDEIPDVRRARRGARGTKTELVLVFRNQ